MASFEQVSVVPDGVKLCLSFRIDQPATIGWQLCDPVTGAYLYEGEWAKLSSHEVQLQIEIPDDGAYQVRVAPVDDRSRMILIDAVREGNTVTSQLPRIETRSAMRRKDF